MNRTYENIGVAVDAGLVTVTLQSPPVHILDGAMCGELLDALRTHGREPGVKAVLFRSEGEKAFSAGASVEEHRPDSVAAMLATFHALIKEIVACPAVTLAAVRGVCLGGGLELVSACDIVLASDRAKFGHPEILLGCFPPAAGPLLRRVAGRHKTAEIIATGETFGAEEALRCGITNRTIPDASFEADCEEYVRNLCAKSAPVLQIAKRSWADLDREAILAEIDRNETLYLKELVREPDMREGIEAFLEKRAPVWSDETT